MTVKMEPTQEQLSSDLRKDEKKKKGFLKRFRRKKNKPSEKLESIVAQESDKEIQTKKNGLKEETSDSFDDVGPTDSDLDFEDNKKNSDNGDVNQELSNLKNPKNRNTQVVLDTPPAARDSAFSGPPRYDWIDIETAAAVKVQSIVRRNQVIDELAAQNKSTAAMRKKSRRRGDRQNKLNFNNGEETPSFFQCCGAGLVFGDSAEEEEKARKAWEKAQYEEKKRQKASEEEKLRTYRPRYKGDVNMNEALEVVE